MFIIAFFCIYKDTAGARTEITTLHCFVNCVAVTEATYYRCKHAVARLHVMQEVGVAWTGRADFKEDLHT